jgi:hypothetical protein
MKILQETAQFQPVTIVLETREEVSKHQSCMSVAQRHSSSRTNMDHAAVVLQELNGVLDEHG